MSNQRQKLIYLGTGCCVFMLIVGWGVLSSLDSPSVAHLVKQLGLHTTAQDKVIHSPLLWDPERYLNGPPTTYLRDNLRPDTKYVTSWPYEGMTNSVIAYCNTIYLGLISSRISVIPPFLSRHLNGTALPLRFSDVFDMSRLQTSIGYPVIEWSDIKQTQYAGSNYSTEALESRQRELLGCWGTFAGYRNESESSGFYHSGKYLQMDVSYTRVPPTAKLHDTSSEDMHSSLFELSRLLLPDGRNIALSRPESAPEVSNELKQSTPPDNHFACFDVLYYASAHTSFEMFHDYSPTWRFVGQYLRFSQKAEDIAMGLVKHAFGLGSDQKMVPYISIHARRGDFAGWCGDVPALEGCFPTLASFARRVKQVQEELASKHTISSPLGNVTRVLMTSDEKDPAWWNEVTKLGWYHIDYSDGVVVQKYGKWWPPIIDTIVQANGAGFVGTATSTMSLMSQRRVQDWNNGPTRIVRWGQPNVDDSLP